MTVSMTQQPQAMRRPMMPGQDMGPAAEFDAMHRALRDLTRACAEALEKSVKHFQGADPWMIGAMPGCTAIADGVEAQARAFLANSQLTGAQIDEVTGVLKAAADLRAVARCARQAAQLSWLLRQAGGSSEALAVILPVAEASLRLSLLAVEAVGKGDTYLALNAARQFREVATARDAAEHDLRGHLLRTQLPPVVLRMTRCAVWFMALSGEGLARVTARMAQ